MSDDRDPAIEQKLRDALSATADTVQPGGDGLMRIQQRIGARRSQQRWQRPALVLGSVVVVAAVAVGGVAIARHNGNGGPIQVGISPTTSPTAVTDDGFPAEGIFPFTNASDEAGWQQGYVSGGHSPWIADPEGVATSWVPYYLKAKDVDQVVDKHVTATTAEVTLGRNTAESGLQPVVVVHLVKFHQAWIVIAASDPHNLLTISTPAAGSSVASPLTVTGPGFGVDEVAKVELRDATTPTLIAEAPTAGFGAGTQRWSATLSFSNPSSSVGVVVAMTSSAADGGVAQIAAEKVVFTKASPVASASEFYGVQNGRLARFNAASGAKEADLDAASNEGTVFEVRQVGGTFYFTAKASDCLAALYSLEASGGSPSRVATADPGYGIVGFDLSADGSHLAYSESGCGDKAGTGALVFKDLSSGARRTVAFPSEPPALIGDPVWEADGVHVDAFVRTGMSGYIARYDSTTATSPTPRANACPGYDVNSGLPGAVATAPDGALWFATQTGTSMQMLSCKDGQPNVELTVPVNGSPTSLAVDADGNILLVDSDGKVWGGSAGGSATELAVHGGVTSVAW